MRRRRYGLMGGYSLAQAIAAGMLGGGTTLLAYLQSLAGQGYIAEMWLADEPSVQAQSGSTLIGQVNGLDATLTNTSWVAGGGLDFDGATSIASVANNTIIANLDSWAWVCIAKWDSMGEGATDKGVLCGWTFDISHHFWVFTNTNALAERVQVTSTDALAVSNNNQIGSFGTPQIYASDYDNANVLGNGRKVRLHNGISGAFNLLTLATDTAAVGTVGDMATSFTIGNDAAVAHTCDGVLYKLIYFNETAISQLSVIYPNLIRLAGV